VFGNYFSGDERRRNARSRHGELSAEQQVFELRGDARLQVRSLAQRIGEPVGIAFEGVVIRFEIVDAVIAFVNNSVVERNRAVLFDALQHK
jgi:hypothetical protein